MSNPALIVAVQGDPSGARQAFATTSTDAQDFAALMEGISRSVETGWQNVQTSVERAGAAHKQTASDASDASDELVSSMLRVVSVVGAAEEVMHLFGESVDWVKESIGHADFVRDLDLSLQAYTGSATSATQVLGYFNDAQIRTRNNAEELDQTFRNLNPLANTKGFSIDAQEQITTMLSQVATVAGTTLDQIENGYRRVLSGSSGGARNPLLAVLGITADQIKTMGWDEFLQKLEQVSAKSAEFGQSWESTMHKAEDSLRNAFADGFNEARGSAVDGMDAITAAVADPQIRTFLHDAGVETAEWISQLAGVATELRGISSLGKDTVASLKDLLPYITLGASVPVSYALNGLGQAGHERGLDDLAASSSQTGANALYAAGLTRPMTATELMYVPGGASGGGMKATGDISGFHDLPNLQKMVGDLIVEDQMNAKQIGEFTTILRDIAGDAKAVGRSVMPQDLTAAASIAMRPEALTGTPHGSINPNADNKAEKARESAIMSIDKLLAKMKEEDDAVRAQMQTASETDPAAKALDTYHAVLAKNADDATRSIAGEAEQFIKLGANAKDVMAAVHGDGDAMKALTDQYPEIKALVDQIDRLRDDRDAIASAAALASGGSLGAALRLPFADATSTGQNGLPAQFDWIRQLTPDERMLLLAPAGYSQFSVMPGQRAPSWLNAETMTPAGMFGSNDEAQFLKDAVAESERSFAQHFDSDFSRIVEDGGRNFAKIIGDGLGSTVESSVKFFSSYLFGTPGDPKKFDAAGNKESPDKIYTPDGQDITDRSKTGQEVLTGAQIAFGGYEAGLSGQPGSRTGSALSGALAGGQIGFQAGGGFEGILSGTSIEGAAIGAVVGAVVSIIGSAVGAAQRQADYQYAIPSFDASGVAHLGRAVKGGENILDPQAAQMTATMQSAFDAIHDALMKDIEPFLGISETIAGVTHVVGAPPQQDISGQFQQNPSGYFMQHFDEWVQNTLPAEELGEFKDDLRTIGVSLGMSSTAFDAYAAKINDLDPSKQAAIYGELFAGMKDIQTSSDFLNFEGMGGSANKSDVYVAAQMAISTKNSTLPGFQMQDEDNQIVDLANSIKDLSPESQAAAIQQLGQMEKQRVADITAGVQQLVTVSEQFKTSVDAIHDSVALGMMTKADGTPDYYSQSQYEKEQADKELELLRTARDSQDAQTYGAAYLADIQKAEQFGMQDSANDPTNQKAWLQWEDQAATIGQSMMDQVIGKLGGSFNAEADRVNALIDPAVQAFLDGIKSATPPPYVSNPPLKGPGSGEPDDPLVQANSLLTTNALSVSTSFLTLMPTVEGVTAVFARLAKTADALDARLNAAGNSGSGNGGAPNPDPHASFVQWNLDQRGV